MIKSRVIKNSSGEIISDAGAYDIISNGSNAVARWIASGMAIASSDDQDKRAYICRGCVFWQEDVRFGYGKCLKCGCGKGKWKLASEKCPIGKW